MTSTDHEKFMELALRLAERGRGKVEPNPLVAAVLVRQGQVIAKGYHRRFGGPHAEINALNDCQESLAGASMYVTLEPCCHQGKTPACTKALIEADPAEVIVATKDPSHKVCGQGIKELIRAGIKVIVGPAGAKARRLNAAFFKLHRRGRPFVLLKWAQSLDGKIATHPGQPRWISNEKSRRFAHQLRRHSQAILVGIGTALADDPLLTARPGLRGRTGLRIVVDSKLRLPVESQLVRTASQTPLLIATTEQALENSKDQADRLKDAGAQLCPVDAGPEAVDLAKLLDILGNRQISNLMVEGGSQILSEFISQGLADEVCTFICPRLIGPGPTPEPLAGRRLAKLNETLELENIRIRRFDDDVLVRGDLPGLDYLYE